MNHLIGSNQLNIVKLPNLIDYPSGNIESIFKILHIHVYHGDALFSKFLFKMGKYDNETLDEEKSRDNKTTTLNKYHQVKYYALKMALEAKRISCENLHNLLAKETFNKN